MKRLVRSYPTIVSTLALVIALVGVGPVAARHLHLISGKRIKNNSIKAKKVKFPRAHRVGAGASSARARASVSDQYAEALAVGSYGKADPTSVLQVTWTGTATAGFSPCVFQLRVDGKAPDGGGGEYLIPNGGNTFSVSDQGLFTGIGAGNHTVSIYARATIGGSDYPCSVGGGGIEQTVNAVELVQ